MKYTKNQSIDLSFTITFDNGLLLANALTHVIEMRWPDKTIHSYPATIVGNTLEVSIPKDTLIQVDVYACWPLMTFEGDVKYYGTAVEFEVVEAWENL